MKDNEFKQEYDKFRPCYELISEEIRTRRELNLTQEELAYRIGTQKSNISRFESGNYNPSLDFLSKLAKGLGKEIHIELNEFIRDMLYYEEEFEETFSDEEHFKK